METGSSENWRDTLSLVIGENRLDGSALREFFQPLEEWLRNENLRTGQFVGWTYGMYRQFYKQYTKTNRSIHFGIILLIISTGRTKLNI